MTRPPERPVSREPWPGPADARDPFADPPHFDADEAWSNYVAAGGLLGRVAHDEAVAACRVALRQAWATGDGALVEPWLGPLLLGAERQPEHRRFAPVESVAPIDTVVRLATDLVPALGNSAPDRLLGPWAHATDARRHPQLYRAATAHGAFLVPDDLPLSAFQRWAGRSPVPLAELRAAVRAIAQAPLTAWPVLSVGATWSLGPAVGLGTSAPDVAVTGPALLPGVEVPRPGDVLVGRVVAAPGQAVAFAPIVCPGPLPSSCEAWVDLLTVGHRLTDRRGSTEDVLRRNGHLLVQRVLEAAWLP